MFAPLVITRTTISVHVIDAEPKSPNLISDKNLTLPEFIRDIHSALLHKSHIYIYTKNNDLDSSKIQIQVITNNADNQNFITSNYSIEGVNKIAQLRHRLEVNDKLFGDLVRSPPKEFPALRPLRQEPPPDDIYLRPVFRQARNMG